MTGFAAVVGCQDIREMGFCGLTSPDIKEGAHYGTNHIPKESVGGDDKIGFSLVLHDPSCLFDIANCGLHIRVRTAERSKVLSSEQQLGGAIHCLKIQPGRYACVVDIEERILARRDTVVVGA